MLPVPAVRTCRPDQHIPSRKGRRFRRAQSARDRRSVPQPERRWREAARTVDGAPGRRSCWRSARHGRLCRIRGLGSFEHDHPQARREVWPLFGLRQVWCEVGKLVSRTDVEGWLDQIALGVLRFDWYVDSRRAIYTRNGTDGRIEIVATNLDTGEERVLLKTNATELSVAPDGTSVAYNSADGHFSMNRSRAEDIPRSGLR